MTEIAADFGISMSTLKWWIAQADVDDGITAGATSAEQAEVVQLRRDSRRLVQENEILRRCSGPLHEGRAPRMIYPLVTDLAAEGVAVTLTWQVQGFPAQGYYKKATARNGRVVGAVRAAVKGDSLHVGRLTVAPDQQGKGIGSVLLRQVEQAAPPGTRRYALFTGHLSRANLRLYERHGYLEVRQSLCMLASRSCTWRRRSSGATATHRPGSAPSIHAWRDLISMSDSAWRLVVSDMDGTLVSGTTALAHLSAWMGPEPMIDGLEESSLTARSATERSQTATRSSTRASPWRMPSKPCRKSPASMTSNSASRCCGSARWRRSSRRCPGASRRGGWRISGASPRCAAPSWNSTGLRGASRDGSLVTSSQRTRSRSWPSIAVVWDRNGAGRGDR